MRWYCYAVHEIMALAAKLPSGLNDARSADKLMAERDEFILAIVANDTPGALTEAADGVYYAVKHIDWLAQCLGLEVDELFEITIAKYQLRARPGNPKNDAAERAVVLEVIDENR